MSWDSTPVPISSLLVKSIEGIKNILKRGGEIRDLTKLPTETTFQKQFSEYLLNQLSGGGFEERKVSYKMVCFLPVGGLKNHLFLILLLGNILKVKLILRKHL